jgi:hypothetical protein
MNNNSLDRLYTIGKLPQEIKSDIFPHLIAGKPNRLDIFLTRRNDTWQTVSQDHTTGHCQEGFLSPVHVHPMRVPGRLSIIVESHRPGDKNFNLDYLYVANGAKRLGSVTLSADRGYGVARYLIDITAIKENPFVLVFSWSAQANFHHSFYETFAMT